MEKARTPITRRGISPVDLDRVARMGFEELRRCHRELFGSEPLVPNTEHLRRKVAWQIQAAAEGGLPDSTLQQALAIARNVDLRIRVCANADRRKQGVPLDRTATTAVAQHHDSRLPMAGSLIVKDFKGQRIVVRVLDGGFEHDGRRFSSLSAIAKDLTGTKWNGYVFFGLTKEGSHAR